MQSQDPSAVSRCGEHWPTLSDRPFRRDDGTSSKIAISRPGGGCELQMWFGFLRAGSVLAEVAGRSKDWPANLVFPALFAYRHGLELAMKAIIRQYRGRTDVEPAPLTHHLAKTWAQCRAVIRDVGCDDAGLDAVERIILDFHEVDLSQQAFRYAFDKNGNQLNCGIEELDLENLRRVMEKVDTFFDLMDGWLDTRCCIADLLVEDIKCPCCTRDSVEQVPGGFRF